MFTNAFYRLSSVSLLAGALTVSLGASGCANRDRGASNADVMSMSAAPASHAQHTTNLFSGAKVNGGSATHSRQGDKSILTLSDDFQVPQTPAPHWQVVDSRGNTYLLQRLTIKGDKFNKTIVVPSYVKDVAKVQIWCAFAETLLGEASFANPVK